MEKILNVLLLTILFVISPQITNADNISNKIENTNSVNIDSYYELVNSGILDESISFEEFEIIQNEDRNNEVKEKAKYQKNNIQLEHPDDIAGAIYSTLANIPTLVRGDILISNGTSSFGLTGHAGIVVGANEILHIAGSNSVPVVISYTTWNGNYGKAAGGMINTEIYRIENWTHRNNAADWADSNYRYSGASYSLLSSLSTLNPTYCSKIVWQAYRYGSSVSLVDNPPTALATPYGLPTYFKSSANLSYIGNF